MQVRLSIVAALACLALSAVAQPAAVVTAPTVDGATLRARLAGAMAPPGRPEPVDAATLDAMLAKGDFEPLAKRLRETHDASAILLDMNWEQARIFGGAGFLVVHAYMNDLWRLGSALPSAQGDPMKGSAGMMLVYALDLARLDGTRCADTTAPGHRQNQLFAQNRAVLDYIHGLPSDRRMTLGTISLAVEGATASLRRDDPVLCSGGLDEIGAGLKANGDRRLPQVPTAPGMVGKTYAVPPAPGYAPRFVAAAIWQPKQTAIRTTLPAELTRLLSLPGVTAPAGR